MIKSDLEQLARTIAAKHKLPPDVVCGMIEREATENQWAVRYEPGFLSRYVMPAYNEGKLDVTETYTRAMSFGLMQIMGQTAREFGFEGKYLTELCDPPVGIEFACRKLADCMKRSGGDIDKALEIYNGGSNKNYSGEVLMLSIPYRQTPTVTKV
jgi:soluble lytic murein transglycosylase-like protein